MNKAAIGQDTGASADADQALVASDEARSDLHPVGFDPSRFRNQLYRLRDSQTVGSNDGSIEVSLDALCDVLVGGHDAIAELRRFRKWQNERRSALDELTRASAMQWGTGSEQHNLVRDVADALFRDASGMEAPSGGETENTGSAEGDSPVAESETPSPDRHTPESKQ